MKAQLLLLSFVAFSPAGVLASEAPDVQFVRGDANADGWFDIGDPISILQHLFRQIPVSCEDAADFDDDGSILVGDVVQLLGYLMQSQRAPRFPFPHCGSDPYPDGTGCTAFEFCQGGPRAAFSVEPPTGFAPLEVAFDASSSTSSGRPIDNWYWDFGDGGSGREISVTHAYLTPGTFQVVLTVTNGDRRTSAALATVVVEERWDQDFVSLEATSVPEGVMLSWSITAPVDQIKVYRGPALRAELPGTALGITVEENGLGMFLYTVGLFQRGTLIRHREVLADRGRLVWDPPADCFDGFVVSAQRISPPGAEEKPGFEAGAQNDIRLFDLHAAGLLEQTGRYVVTAKTRWGGALSGPCSPVTFDYEVATQRPNVQGR